MPYVPVVQNENDTPVELPLETDSTLLLSTLQAAFPRACGLVFKCQQSGTSRGVRLVEGRFYPPEEGWFEQVTTNRILKLQGQPSNIDTSRFLAKATNADMFLVRGMALTGSLQTGFLFLGQRQRVFLCTTSNDLKRKSDDDDPDSPPKKKAQLISDLIILGLPWRTTEEQVKEYFEKFGEVTMATVKKNPRTGQSKGFGFVRFGEFSAQTQVIGQRHMIDGRWCDVKIPYSQAVDASQACKIFVGQLKAGITQEEIKAYFSEHGDVTDVYVPQPFRQFAFVTFSEPFTAKAVCAQGNHSINGSPVNVSVAIPPARRSGKGSPLEQRGAGWPTKRRYGADFDDFGDQNFFNASGEWNAKQGRNSMLWDESSWDVGHYTGYTSVRGMGY